jgi:hypothetical protein
MKDVVVGLLMAWLWCAPASAWYHAGAYGRAYGGGGSWSATGYRGGTAAGGGGYWSTTSAYGTVAYGSAYHGAYYSTYHPPTTVNVYGSGCYDCGGWSTAAAAASGATVGAAAGAAVASANTGAAASSAYTAGYAAGRQAAPAYAIGAIYATLPAGCDSSATVGRTLYYLCGDAWFKPCFGANGVYYRVVPTP